MGLFSRKPAFESTGNAGDDQLLSLLAKAPGGHEAPRHWIHYAYCANEEGAAHLEARASEAGWTVSRVVPDYHGIVAERAETVVNPASVRESRLFFESIAAEVAGGEYDGWEASAG